MTSLRLPVRTLPPLLEGADADVGLRLGEIVRLAVERGGAPPAAAVLRPDRTDILPLGPVATARLPIPQFLAGLTRSRLEGAADVEAVALIGLFRAARPQGEPTTRAVTFVEWPDGRWWFWHAGADVGQRALIDGTDVVTSASDGDPLPDRLGRWWSLGRRLGVHVDFNVRPKVYDEH